MFKVIGMTLKVEKFSLWAWMCHYIDLEEHQGQVKAKV